VSITRLQSAATQRLEEIVRTAAIDLRRLREDVGLTQRALARAAAVDQSLVSKIERGLARPTLETYVRLATALGADPSLRFYPNTGPAIRDRHQARIVEGLLGTLAERWRPWPEVGVRQPVRGWIDVVLVDARSRHLIAVEVQSGLHRLEQLLRWSQAKSEALPSAAAWPFGIAGDVPSIGRLLLVRDTAATRIIVTTFEATIRAAYPGDSWQAMAALTGTADWPEAALLWASDGRNGTVALHAASSHRGLRRRAA
jgi:transcriptional regulator with XRE-family HTH domain